MKRIVIDGTVGSGKTTLIKGYSLKGISSPNQEVKTYPCLANLGYNTIGEAIRGTIAHFRENGKEPYELINGKRIASQGYIDYVIDLSVKQFHAAKPNQTTFYDRGIPYLELHAKFFGEKVPKKYYEYCKKYRYDNPVFVVSPIPTLNLENPLPGDEKIKIYTWKMREDEHQKTMEIYKNFGYEVVEVPIMHENMITNINMRLDFIKKYLKL